MLFYAEPIGLARCEAEVRMDSRPCGVMIQHVSFLQQSAVWAPTALSFCQQ